MRKRLEVFAYRTVEIAARDAYNALWRWGTRIAQMQRGEIVVGRDMDGVAWDDEADGLQELYDTAEITLLGAIRIELQIVPPGVEPRS